MHVSTLFIWFVLYSILGWIYETAYCSVKSLKWDDRGMLIGPYCPIYGVGAVLDVLLLSGLPNWKAVFLACMLGSAVLEYTTSYLTERIFHAVWWDYSNIPFNFHGRICLPCSLGFGVAGIVVLYGIHPYMLSFTNLIPLDWQEPAALALMAVFAADCALTADSLIGLNSLKEKISFEEFRERKMGKELKRAISTMNWTQMRALRSSVSFRRTSYSELGNKMRHLLSFHRKPIDEDLDSKLHQDG